MEAAEANFMCLEPWYGICDKHGYTGDFEARPGMNIVEA